MSSDLFRKYENLLDVLESAQLILKGSDNRVFSRRLESKIYTLQNKIDSVFKSDDIEIVVRKKKKVKSLVESENKVNVELIY
jgi:hypothetical protein